MTIKLAVWLDVSYFFCWLDDVIDLHIKPNTSILLMAKW
jgi:hypothetical protein